MKKFVHLHVHSHYSLLNALPKIKELIKEAKKQEMPAIALTDNGNLYGAIEFYKECKKQEIKGIIGVDAYVSIRKMTDKDGGIDNSRTRVILLAKNLTGYKNLVKLVTKSYLEGFYYKPRIDRKCMEEFAEGLIAISNAFNGEVASALTYSDFDKAKEIISWYKKTFGEDNFFIEITKQDGIQGHKEKMDQLIDLAKSTNTQIVAGQDIYYMKPEDKKARETLMSVQNGGNPMEKRAGLEKSDEDFSFRSADEMIKSFKDIPNATDNTVKIADMCDVTLDLGKWTFPKIETHGMTHDEELRKLTFEGIPKRGLTETPEVLARIEYELKVIKDKGYSPYFLTVSDLLRFAHENGILTTIRGSVGGSLVTYLTNITNVDPLKYKLPFERFLNPERPSAPDIDMDYADNRRDEMIAYARRKYGENNVAQIGTFGTMMARGAVKDAARAMGFPYNDGDRISKLIPIGAQGFPMTIARALAEEPDFKKLYDTDKTAKEIVDMAKKIEGCARHISVHAAGVVISPTPLTDFTPLQFDPKGGKIITQYDMHAVEDAGLLKFDFLGIKNLSILADAVKIVEKLEGIKIDIENVPVDDKKTFEMLAKGETIGLFQLNGSGMTKYLMELKPTQITDINAMVALYRPGPLESIPEYIKRKNNPMFITFLDPRMKDILDQSYGVITYQDDVMLIAIKLGGYSWLEADKLRKAMGKKIPEEMQAQKQKLHDGLIKNGMSEEKAAELWQLIEPFAAYGFNKAHAASYGKVAYQTAYMKANFPAIYMSAVLTADSGDVEEISSIIEECKRMGLKVLPPSVNESFGGFTVVKSAGAQTWDTIRFGLYTIKNFGEGIADAVIAERKKSGVFKSLEDLLKRVTDKNMNRKSLDALIRCGALDELGDRSQMIGNIENILAYSKEQKTASNDQDSLFSTMQDQTTVPKLRLAPMPQTSIADRLAGEKELLGLYISGHPLDGFKEKIEQKSASIKTISENIIAGVTTVFAGIIEEQREIMTKKGDKMLFLRISDKTGSLEAVVFPKTYEEFKDIFTLNHCVVIKGTMSLRNGAPSIVIEKIKKLE